MDVQMPFQTISPFAMEARKELLSPYIQGQRVLEIGCAQGELLAEIQQDAHLAVGIDPCRDSLAHAQHNNARIVRGVPGKIPFAAHTFDTVCSFDTIPHVEGVSNVIREFARVVRPGGHILIEAQNRLSASYWTHSLLGQRGNEKSGRFDLLVELKQSQPFELELVDVAGIQVTSPASKVFDIPGLGTLWKPFEKLAQRSPLRFFGATLILVLRKREDLNYKER